jgi:5,6-dimethylbenzimidazole synthase
MDLYEAIRKRVACRAFTKQMVPKEKILKILEAGNMAPSPENYQPWEFIIIEDPKIREALTELKLESRRQVLKETYPNLNDEEIEKRVQGNKTALQTASYLIAVCYKDVDNPAETGNMKLSFSSIAAWTCISYMWLAATAEGLGMSPTFYSYHVYNKVKKLLGLPENCHLAAVIRIGYPAKKPLGRKKTVKPLKSKLHLNTFGNPYSLTME